MPAHPRSRGENAEALADQVADVGSSPLTRGKRTLSSLTILTIRLIPAHAGKTRDLPLDTFLVAAHPRSRGENYTSQQRRPGLRGSSPLTRGKRGRAFCASMTRGLIPAHAGKTRAWRRHRRSPGVHPRSRGENLGVPAPRIHAAGSSPLTRGKRWWPRPDDGATRLIPAHAGKTK